MNRGMDCKARTTPLLAPMQGGKFSYLRFIHSVERKGKALTTIVWATFIKRAAEQKLLEDNMMRKFVAWGSFAALAALLAMPLLAQRRDAKAVVDDAIRASGYEGLNTIEYIGSGEGEGGVGQAQSPIAGWDKRTLKNYSRFIDYAAGTSQRNAIQSRPMDATGQLSGGGGLPPNNAQADTPNTANIAANATWAQRFEISLSPPGFLKMAAAATNPTMATKNLNGRRMTVISFLVDQKAPSGVNYQLTGYIDSNNLVARVETAVEENTGLVGDMVVLQDYSSYRDFNGVRFPTHITQRRAGLIHADFTITDVKKNSAAPPPLAAAGGGRGGAGAAGGRGGAPAAAAGRGGAPAGGGAGRGGDGAAAGGRGGGRGGDGAAAGGRGGRGGDAPAAAARGGVPLAPGAPAAAGGRGAAAGGGGQRGAAIFGSRKLGDGIYLITGGYPNVAIEFKDYVAMIDAPQNGTDAVIAEIKKVIPNKPIRYLINTHAHFDHIGGLRTAMLEDLTVITHDMNKDMYEEWFKNPRTLNAGEPDAFARSGKKPKFQYMGEKKVLKDSMNTVELYHLHGVKHSEDMIVVYLPKIKAVFEADAFNPPAPNAAIPTGDQISGFERLFASELDRLKIDYTHIYSGHQPGGGDRDITKEDLLRRVGRL